MSPLDRDLSSILTDSEVGAAKNPYTLYQHRMKRAGKSYNIAMLSE